MASATPPHKATIAIDIGTRYSGYAYQIEDSPAIEVCTRWGEDAAIGLAYKAPTHVLLESDGKFIAFGEDANNYYFEEADDTLLFFENFKMVLYDESKGERNLDPNKVELTAANGKKHPALEVFAAAMSYLKGHAIGLMKDTKEFDLDPKDILWVLTVPAIWDISAKFFMRQAAYKAGLIEKGQPDRLIISLEPESAALYCRTLPIGQFMTDVESDLDESSKDAKEFAEMRPGSTYVVIDAGGGTLDMTALQVTENGGVHELVQASGGAHGGAEVDKLFIALLEEIFSEDFISQFRQEDPVTFQQILHDFEYKKRMYDPKSERPRVEIPLPYTFHQEFQKDSNRTVQETVEEFKVVAMKNVEVKRKSNLQIQRPLLDYLFAPVVDRIKEEVIDFIKQQEVQEASVFFLVGGFAPFLSLHLRPIIKERFKHAKIPVPLDAGVAVLKGAVIFGQDPTVVQERVSRQTYGIGVDFPFIEGTHRSSLKIYDSEKGKDYCKNIFKPLVRAGEKIRNKEVKTTELEAILSGGSIPIYLCKVVPQAGEVLYTCDKDKFVLLGSIPLPPTTRTATGERPTLLVQFRVGGTELQVTVKNEETKETFYTEVVFS